MSWCFRKVNFEFEFFSIELNSKSEIEDESIAELLALREQPVKESEVKIETFDESGSGGSTSSFIRSVSPCPAYTKREFFPVYLV